MKTLWASLKASILAVSGVVVVSAQVAPRLQPYVDKHELAGAVVMVADREKVLAYETVGWADIAGQRPMAKDTLFWIASQSKAMTAVAVLMLVDEGKIALDDPVEKYLPEFRQQMLVVEKDANHVLLKKPSHPITLREVLSHTSGLPFKSEIETPTLDGLPLAVAVRSYALTPLQTEPGTHYQYSNAGINTAARVLEVVSKMPYEQFMQTRIFTPLGMKDTTFWPNAEQVSRLAKSYRPNEAKTDLVEAPLGQLKQPLTDQTHRFPMPAGGLFSTAADTLIFCQMLLNQGQWQGRRYLSEKAFQELTQRQTAPAIKESYGFGLTIGPDFFGHGGANATNMEIRQGANRVLIWMVQHNGFVGAGGKAQGTFKEWALRELK
jgi:CubicO group peptidase (beta-lactamase class C family)